MTRQLAAGLALTFLAALPAGAQSASAACGETDHATAHQFIRVYGDLRICMLAFTTDSLAVDGPRAWTAKAGRMVYETQRANDFRRMAIAGDAIEWTINGQPRPADSAALAWRQDVLDVLAPAWEAARLREEVSRLRQRIDSLPALRQRATARSDSIEKALAAARARIASLEQADRSIDREIAGYEARIRELQSQSSRVQMRTSSPDPNVRARAEAELEQIRRQERLLDESLRRAQQRADGLDADRRISAMELDIRTMRPEHQLALLKLELDELKEENIPLLRQELRDLDPDNRLRVLDDAIAIALARLRSSLPPTP